MSDMPIWQSFLSVIGGVGGLCGIYALVQNWEQTKLAREQTRLMREQAKKSEEQERELRRQAECLAKLLAIHSLASTYKFTIDIRPDLW